MRKIAAVVIVIAVVAAGCRNEPPGPTLVGGREPDYWLHRLEDRDASNRREAIRKLGNAGNLASKTRPALSRMLRDRDPLVRRETIYALHKLSNLSAEESAELESMRTRDPDHAVRDAAVKALAQSPRIE